MFFSKSGPRSYDRCVENEQGKPVTQTVIVKRLEENWAMLETMYGSEIPPNTFQQFCSAYVVSEERRETDATTGTRIRVQFFGGWDVEKEDAEYRDLPFIGYTKGVTMGSDFAKRSGDKASSFLVCALGFHLSNTKAPTPRRSGATHD